MARKVTFLLLSVAAVLFLQFADCVSAMAQDEQSMQCCGSMPCDPSNSSHDCCKAMLSSQSPSALPAAHVALHAPAMLVVYTLPLPAFQGLPEVSRAAFAAPRLLPPELYVLHSALLI